MCSEVLPGLQSAGGCAERRQASAPGWQDEQNNEGLPGGIICAISGLIILYHSALALKKILIGLLSIFIGEGGRCSQ